MNDRRESMAERRIRDAQARGEFDRLPGAGRPLHLGDDSMVPPELRAAYRLLKNAGYVPEEVRIRQEIAALEDLVLSETAQGAARAAALRRLSLLRTWLGGRGGERAIALDGDYRDKLLEKLSG